MVMRREFSAGLVLVRRMRGAWWLAAARPQGKRRGRGRCRKASSARARLRPRPRCGGYEETGVSVRLGPKLGDVRYVYTWQGERVFKVVSFFLAHARAGRIGELPAGMEVEVAEARWLRLDDARPSARV